jgi:branched-subunit amino acid transport protein
MNPWPVFLGMAAVTFATRYAGIAVAGHDLPEILKRWLRYVPIAVLAALIAPDALVPQGQLAFGASTVALLAGLVVAWRTRNVFLTLIAGMATFWFLKLLRLT